MKINHDSLWVKLQLSDKTWIKLVINRSGVNVKSTLTKVMYSKYNDILTKEFKIYEAKGLSYGELIDNCEIALTKEGALC